MAPQMKKKYETGEGSQFWTRAKAMKKLQLSLKDFRRLCILKGIYPREPKSRKRAQQGSTTIKTLYHKKDIQFLLHEPIIQKFREAKVIGRKIGRAKSMRDFRQMKNLINDKPHLKLDHIVKERYPTFLDALRDLDDCLTMCCLFSTFPKLKTVPHTLSSMCRRLTLEFMHVVIMSQALRKVFVSIKGYYFQAEIKGQTISWIVPHYFSFEPQSKEEVDFKIMGTFVQFYTVLLGFVNFRLFHEFNILYPPSLSKEEDDDKELVDKSSLMEERIAALNIPLIPTCKESDCDDVAVDTFNLVENSIETDELKKESEKLEKLKSLFKGLKVYLNREVPREPLTFVLRCFGAEVSWDKQLFVGATFPETDESITHQIVDRPSLESQYISRYYVQPQWVFDSVNSCELKNVENYFVGCTLPPHLSPFTDPGKVRYEPPEIFGKTSILKGNFDKKYEETEIIEGENDVSEDSDMLENVESQEEEEVKRKKMVVIPGELEKVDPIEMKKEEKQERRLRERMIPRKHKALFRSMMKGRRNRSIDIKTLRKKRIILEKKNMRQKQE